MASLDDAYASAAATKRRLQEEGQEQSPFLPFLNQAATDLTEDTKLSNMLDPDYVESGIGSIIGLVAPQLKENVLERKLAERAEMDLKLFESRVGLREAQEQERVQNIINGNAAADAAALKKDWDLNGQPLVNTIADPAFSTSIFDYFAKNNNKAKFDILRKLSTEGRKLRLEDTPITGAGTPLFSFQQDGKTWNAYDPNRLEQDKYQSSMKDLTKYIKENITTENTKLSQEVINALRDGTLTSEQKKIVRNDSGYKAIQKAGIIKNQNAVLNYPPITKELGVWQAEYTQNINTKLTRAYGFVVTANKLLSNKLAELQAEKYFDSKLIGGKAKRIKAEIDILANEERKLKNTYTTLEKSLTADTLKKRDAIAMEMIRVSQRQNTTIYTGNVNTIRLAAERIVAERDAKEQGKNVVAEKPADATKKKSSATLVPTTGGTDSSVVPELITPGYNESMETGKTDSGATYHVAPRKRR